MMQVHVLGAGKIGSAFIDAIYQSEAFKLGSIISSRKHDGNTHSGYFKSFEDVQIRDGLLLLCVPDDFISEVAEKLAESGKVNSNCVVAHVSGARSSHELTSLKEIGIAVASFHPMQSFTDKSTASDFNNVQCSIEGDSEAAAVLHEFSLAIGALPVFIDAETKRAMHAAGVVISNFMSALFLYAGDILHHQNSELGTNFIREHFAVIAKKTLDNILVAGLPDAITGPASRGDIQTILKHIHSLPNDETRDMYKALTHRIAKECLHSKHPLFDILKNDFKRA